MKARPTTMLVSRMLGLVLVFASLAGCTFEQVLIGQWYSIQTPPVGACSGLQWRFEVDAQRSIGGFISRDGQQPIANISGRLNPDDSFQITLTDVAEGRTANVTGQFTSQVSTIAVHGNALGSGCDGQTFKLRLGRYFASQGGGGGGGGGG